VTVNGRTLTRDGAYLGITPHYVSGAADTLGLLVQDVEEGMAADKAGIRRGDRLVSIDDVDLRVDPNDLGDSAGEVLPESRLRRFLSRKRAGDAASVVVYADGRTETKRVLLSESPLARTFGAMRERTGRRVLGVSFSQRGSMRDTAGLLITDISSGGAADRAGLSEGDRVISVDGVDLRVSAADAGSSEGVEARISRLRRALDAAKDSQPVRVEVLSDGRRRTVSLTPTLESGFVFTTSGLEGLANDLRASVRTNFDWSGERGEAMRAQAELLRSQAGMQRELARTQRDAARAQRDGARMSLEGMNGSWRRDNGEEQSRVRGTIRGRTNDATLMLDGLSLAAVDRDFAQQFGRGSEDGALVVRTRGEWDPIRTGDVILTVEGRSVRDGDSLDLSFDRRRDQRLEILRNGRKETITLPAAR
jgi:S1-C subfamily serine protease